MERELYISRTPVWNITKVELTHADFSLLVNRQAHLAKHIMLGMRGALNGELDTNFCTNLGTFQNLGKFPKFCNFFEIRPQFGEFMLEHLK